MLHDLCCYQSKEHDYLGTREQLILFVKIIETITGFYLQQSYITCKLLLGIAHPASCEYPQTSFFTASITEFEQFTDLISVN